MNSKIVISIVIWLVSLPLLGLQLMFTVGLVVEGYKQLPAISLQVPGAINGLGLLLSFVLGSLSWVALFVMNKGWLQNKTVSRTWPIAGTICAVAGLIPVKIPILLAATPEIVFACFLCLWHIKNDKLGRLNV